MKYAKMTIVVPLDDQDFYTIGKEKVKFITPKEYITFEQYQKDATRIRSITENRLSKDFTKEKVKIDSPISPYNLNMIGFSNRAIKYTNIPPHKHLEYIEILFNRHACKTINLYDYQTGIFYKQIKYTHG